MKNKILRIFAIAWSMAKKKRNASSKMKKRIMQETSGVDFTNITHDWQKAQRLQAELRRKCHPDRFSDDLVEKATEIFQAVGRNRYNYEELLKLKAQAIEELHITITEQ